MKATAAIDEVKTTLLTEGVFKQVLRTLIVPFTAGSSNSACKKKKKHISENANKIDRENETHLRIFDIVIEW